MLSFLCVIGLNFYFIEITKEDKKAKLTLGYSFVAVKREIVGLTSSDL